MSKRKLSRDWEYTGMTFHQNLERTGVLDHFYYDAHEKVIYQVADIRRTKGGEIGAIKFGPELEADIRFIETLDQRSREETEYRDRNISFDITAILRDREVKHSK